MGLSDPSAAIQFPAVSQARQGRITCDVRPSNQDFRNRLGRQAGRHEGYISTDGPSDPGSAGGDRQTPLVDQLHGDRAGQPSGVNLQQISQFLHTAHHGGI